jgi:hypothetical protein
MPPPRPRPRRRHQPARPERRRARRRDVNLPDLPAAVSALLPHYVFSDTVLTKVLLNVHGGSSGAGMRPPPLGKVVATDPEGTWRSMLIRHLANRLVYS